MKLHKIIIPITVFATILSSCYDEKMEWGTPDGHGEVNISDIPLSVAEQLANYDYIKNYAAQYMPNSLIGLGTGTELYIEEPEFKQIADENFQMFTTGNEMKHDAIVSSTGALNFDAIDEFLTLVPADMKLYGHNFIWHTQQRQSYLQGLVAPTPIIESNPGDVCENVIPNSDFESGSIVGWSTWGNATQDITTPGYDGSQYAMIITNTVDGQAYEAQTAYTFNEYLDTEATYVIQFYAKSNVPGGKLQVAYQNGDTYGSQGLYHTFNVGTDWTLCNVEFSVDFEDVNRILINSGEIAGEYTIDNFQFGIKIGNPDAERTNMITNSDFATGIDGWGVYNGGECSSWNEAEGNWGVGCLQVINTTDNPNSQWNIQVHSDLNSTIAEGTPVYISYYIRTLDGIGSVRCSTTGATHYQSDQTVTSVWQRIEWEITTEGGDLNGLNFDLGAVANTYLIDDVVVSTDPFAGAETASTKAVTRAAGLSYQLKTDEEKRTALLNAMETWIKGMLEHISNDGRFVGWDVINEPITDDGYFRGIDNHFGGTWTDNSGITHNDMTPVESEESGLELNWGDGHFYWGYFLGMDYAVKAFEFARQYAPANIKLFVNDYGLESNPNKLAKLIELVEYIEQHGQTVDGIGTQMHLTASSITREQIDAMFKTMAATGKLIRVTELDVALGTSAPTEEQLLLQSDVYQMVFESYKENVPEAQQSGITIWTLSDNEREHVYWLPDQSPNIFDTNYNRKYAYKGVCDGIAGFDIGTEFDGDDWENAYENEEESAEEEDSSEAEQVAEE